MVEVLGGLRENRAESECSREENAIDEWSNKKR